MKVFINGGGSEEGEVWMTMLMDQLRHQLLGIEY